MTRRMASGGKCAVVATAAALCAGVVFNVAPAHGADPMAYGKHLSGECTSCHRIDGQDKGIPSITGWEVGDFVATLMFYKNGQRDNPAMKSVAQSLDDEQMKALATYFSSLPKAPTKKAGE